MLFMSRQRRIEAQLDEYRENVAACLERYREAFVAYCQTADRAVLERNLAAVHKAESKADDIRREVEVLMYSKALFPESRGDMLGLLESMDKVPNQAETATKMLLMYRIEIPEALAATLMRLVRACCACGLALVDSSAKLFEDFTNATVAVGKVDELESEVDQMEASLFDAIFGGDYAPFDKLMLRDVVKQAAAVSDRAEDAADRIRIIVAKRRV